MENSTYNMGPQLPNYMKKQAKVAAPASSARTSKAVRTAGTGAAAKKTSASSSAKGRSTATTKTKRASTSTAKTKKKSSAGTASAAKKSSQSAKSASTAKRSSTNTNKKKARQKAKRTLRTLIVAACALACIIGIVWLSKRDSVANIPQDLDGLMETKKTFKDGVKLIGVDVRDMTPEEATGLVSYAAEKKLGTVAITVALKGETWTFSAKDLGMGYDLAEMFAKGLEYGRTEDANIQDVSAPGAGEFDAKYTWDREAILAALAQIAPNLEKEATQPYAEPVTDWTSAERFTYIAGEEGWAMNAEATADAIEAALRTGEFTATIEPIVNAVLPTMTIDDVMAHTQYRAEYTTEFSAPKDDEVKQNRLFNIQKASDIINGNVIQPGEEWSFNTVVGPRTYDTGWKGANGISGGKEYTIQAGGGICQPSTTLFNALVCANIEITDRRHHTIPSDYVDVGLDATVDTRGIDFVFRNNTEYPLYIFAEVKNVQGRSSRYQVTVYVYGDPLPEGVTYKTRSEIIEATPRDTGTKYANDSSIPTGYQKEKIQWRYRYVAEAYQDKYVDGKLVESKLMYTDTYAGNVAEINVGTGAALAEGQAVPEGCVPYGTAPTAPKKRG